MPYDNGHVLVQGSSRREYSLPGLSEKTKDRCGFRELRRTLALEMKDKVKQDKLACGMRDVYSNLHTDVPGKTRKKLR